MHARSLGDASLDFRSGRRRRAAPHQIRSACAMIARSIGLVVLPNCRPMPSYTARRRSFGVWSEEMKSTWTRPRRRRARMRRRASACGEHPGRQGQPTIRSCKGAATRQSLAERWTPAAGPSRLLRPSFEGGPSSSSGSHCCATRRPGARAPRLLRYVEIAPWDCDPASRVFVQ